MYKSVSYTHLDVYKRQPPNHLEFWTDHLTFPTCACRLCSQSCCGRLDRINTLPASGLPRSRAQAWQLAEGMTIEIPVSTCFAVSAGYDLRHGLPRSCASAFLAGAGCLGVIPHRFGRRPRALEPLVFASATLRSQRRMPEGTKVPRLGVTIGWSKSKCLLPWWPCLYHVPADCNITPLCRANDRADLLAPGVHQA